MSALSREKVLASFHAIDALAREANVPYQHAFDALNALVVAYEDPHAAEALRVRLRKYEGGTTPAAFRCVGATRSGQSGRNARRVGRLARPISRASPVSKWPRRTVISSSLRSPGQSARPVSQTSHQENQEPQPRSSCAFLTAPSTKPAMSAKRRDALLAAIAKARGWIEGIRLGRFASFAEIAEHEAR
jgi:hypothetical protein